jgi:hypothetical protein
MLLGEWKKFNQAGWRQLISWTWLRPLINLIFKLLLKGKGLGCNFEFWWRLGDLFFTQRKNLENCQRVV